MNQNLSLPVDQVCGQLLYEILSLSYREGDPGLPPNRPLQFDDGQLTLRFPVVWESIGLPSIKLSHPPVTIELPSLDEESFLWLGSFYIERRNVLSNTFNGELGGAIGLVPGEEASWEKQIARFVALPSRPPTVLALLRKLIALDAILFIVAKCVEGETELTYVTNGGDPGTWSILAALKVIRHDLTDYLQGWCKMLDAVYQQAPGSFYQRLDSRLQELLLRKPKPAG